MNRRPFFSLAIQTYCYLLGVVNVSLFLLVNSDAVIVIFQLISLVLLMMLFWWEGRNISYPPFFITGFFIIWNVLGNLINFHMQRYVSEAHYRYIPLLILVSYMAFIFGYYLVQHVKIRQKPIVIGYFDRNTFELMLMVITLISFSAAALYVWPIIKALVVGSYFSNRIDMIFGRGYLNMASTFHSYTVPGLLVVDLFSRKRVRRSTFFLIAISFLLNAIPMHRGAILATLIMYMIIYNDFYKRITFKKLSMLGCLAVFSLGAIFPALRGNERAFSELIINELGIHMWNLSRYIFLHNEIGNLGMAPLTMALAILLPGHQQSFEIWIKQFGAIDVNVGGASLSLIGEGYLEFGLIGVAANYFVLGVLISWLYRSRRFSLYHYFIFIYVLNRSESIIQFGFGKVLLSLIIVTSFVQIFRLYSFRVK